MNELGRTFKIKLSSLSLFAVGSFFLTLLLIGVSIYKDYGISWDEPVGKKNGVISAFYANHKLDYLFLSEEEVDKILNTFVERAIDKEDYTGTTILNEYKDKDYGVIFEFYLIGAQFLAGITDDQSAYHLRHILTFFFFFAGIFAFYFVGLEIFKDWKLALLACLFLVLSPRIFAHSFYNSKDIPFMSAYIWTLYTMLKFLKKKNFKWALLHAFTTAILIAIRIPGVIIPAITLVFFLADEISGSFLGTTKKKRWSAGIIYSVFWYLLLILFWPYLWENPWGNFIESFHSFSRFRYEGYLLFWGDLIWVTDMPWHYTLSWITITTPMLYILLFIIGCAIVVKDIFKGIKDGSFYKYASTRNKIIIGATFAGPLVALLIFDSVVYNGWRHSYFIYPSLIIFTVNALPALTALTKKTLGSLGKKLLFGMLLVYISYISYTIILLHPHQHDYFNFIAGKSVEKKFDVDYWNLSYKAGLDYLIKQEECKSFSAGAHITYPISLNTKIFSKTQRDRMQINTIENTSDYIFITSYDRYKYPHAERFDFSNFKKIKVISVGNIPMLEIYKRRGDRNKTALERI